MRFLKYFFDNAQFAFCRRSVLLYIARAGYGGADKTLRRVISVKIREYTEKDIPAMVRIWNEVVEDGIAFPQERLL